MPQTSEKLPSHSSDRAPTEPKTRRWTWTKLILLTSTALLGARIILNHSHSILSAACHHLDHTVQVKGTCPQPSHGLVPDKHRVIHDTLLKEYKTPEFLLESVQAISGAIQIPTESGDDYGVVGEEPRWDIFESFHAYLKKQYPLIHSTLELTKVNTYGLVYLWPGTNPDLKPIVLVAHQDVVPVNPDTVDQWEHPPYSGYFDGELVWGRGSSDDKSGLIAVLSAVENLIKQGFQPARPILINSGFDEECSGRQGAQKIVAHLLEKYGRDSLAMVIDEGGGFAEQYGTYVAMPNVGEKGYTDVKVAVNVPGGHSSVPPTHTAIGILADAIRAIEANTFKPILSKTSSVHDTVQCIAEHAPTSFSKKLRAALKRGSLEKAAELLLQEHPEFLPLLRTTTAVDVVHGGVKANALPENAYAIVNHRVSIDSSIGEVQTYYKDLLEPLAEKYNLSLSAFAEDDADFGPKRALTLSEGTKFTTEPIPKAPTFGSSPWDVLAGTIVSSFQSFDHGNNSEILVIPSMSTGNTDARYYGELTKSIYRYIHRDAGKGPRLGGAHTVNEALSARSLVEMIAFFTTLILNADESRSL